MNTSHRQTKTHDFLTLSIHLDSTTACVMFFSASVFATKGSVFVVIGLSRLNDSG